MTDLLIAGATLITMDAARRVIPDGAIAISGGRIAAIGPACEIALAHPAAETLDARHMAALPGLFDGHAHAGHGLIKTIGAGRPDAWETAVNKVYQRGSGESFWRAEARLAALERLRCGVTTGLSFLGGGDTLMRTDAPAFGDRHCEAVMETGIRNVLAVGPARPPFPRRYVSHDGGACRERHVTFADQLAVTDELIGRWHGRDGRVFVAVVLPVFHPADVESGRWNEAEIAGYARAARTLARDRGVRFTQDGHKRGSLAYADRLGLLGPDALMSHCVDITEEEVALIAATGTVVVHNPSAIASIRGRCPAVELLEAGAHVILGSDGTAPDRGADMIRHGWQAMHYHRRHFRDETVLPPGKVLEMMTIDAARAFGLAAELGSLEPGKQADIVLFNMRKPHLYPPHMPVHRIACFASGADVDTVIVAGRVLMRGRRVLTVDEDDVLDDAAREADAMVARNGLASLMELPPNFWSHARL